MLKPDALIYCTVTKNERIRRLQADSGNKYHTWLINHNQYIEKRENIYQKYFDQAAVPKIKIDTTDSSVYQSANKIISFIATIY